MSNWQEIDTAPDGRLVMTKVEDHNGTRNEQPLKKDGRLWFAGDMYMYYEPTHWRELTDIERMELRNEAERKAIAQLKRAHADIG